MVLRTTKMMEATRLVCDYLVVGAGATSMAFIDTLLTELPSTKIVLVDKKDSPGGHWVDSYGFVRLHQPSLLYGVSSKQLEGSWMNLLFRSFTLPWKHRASKDEILSYYKSFVDEKVAAGQIQYFPRCHFNFEEQKDNVENNVDTDISINDDETNNLCYSFESIDGTRKYDVEVKEKLVNAVLGECVIPSLTPLQFPVDPSIQVWTPNQVFDTHRRMESVAATKTMMMLDDGRVVQNLKSKSFVVLGGGKTGMDTVVYLQREMGISPESICWIIPNDSWMFRREGDDPMAWPKALLAHGGHRTASALAVEKGGNFVRLDESILPTKFRFTVVGSDELELMRNVFNVIRKGRVTAIRQHTDNNDNEPNGEEQNDDDNSCIAISFGENHDDWKLRRDPENVIFVHCTGSGPFNGKTPDSLFVSKDEIALYLMYAPPMSISMSCIAMLEAARRKGTLDVGFGRKLLQAVNDDAIPVEAARDDDDDKAEEDINTNEILKDLILPFQLHKSDESAIVHLMPTVSLGLFLGLVDKDPLEVFKWMQGNRLCFLSIPGLKCNIYEDLDLLIRDGKHFGFTTGQIRMMELLQEKLKPLEGK